MGSSGCALSWSGSSGVAGFIGVRCGGRRVFSGPLGSFRFAFAIVGFAGFIGVHPGVRRVHPGSLGSSGWSSGFAGLIGVRPSLVGFIWVHMGASWGFGVCPEGRRVRAVFQCLLECSWGPWVYAWSLGSLGCVLGVVGFIRVNWGAIWGSWCSSRVAEFIGVRLGGRWGHTG